MTTNEFVVVGAVGARPSVRALDRGRVHQARFEVWTGEDAIACQLTRSDPKGLRRLTDGLEPGRMVVVTGMLDTRIADVGGLRLPVLIPFVQHVQVGDIVGSVPPDRAGDGGVLKVPIGFTRFRVEGMVAAEARRARVGRGHGAHVSVRSGSRTVGVAVVGGTREQLERRLVGIAPGAGVSAVGYLRTRMTGGGLSVLEAVAFAIEVERPVVLDGARERTVTAKSLVEVPRSEADDAMAFVESVEPMPFPVSPALASAGDAVGGEVLA